jgi:hypothetical protein
MTTKGSGSARDRKGEGAAWTPDAIVRLARRHLGMAHSVFYAPSIPHDKLGKARAAHALHLPEDEPILVLYDDTLFGGAKDGFVVTPERLCWKNFWEHPRQVEWSALEPSVIAEDSGKISIAGGGVLVHAELVPAAAAFFIEMASRGDISSAGPYRTAEPPPPIRADAVMPVERIIALARQHVGEVEDLYFHPSIPRAKLLRARAAHEGHLSAGEVVAVLFDDTVFGSAEEGFLLTSQRLCWKNISTNPEQLPYREIALDTITVDEQCVRVMGGALQFTACNELVGPVAQLLRVIIEEVQGGWRE